MRLKDKWDESYYNKMEMILISLMFTLFIMGDILFSPIDLFTDILKEHLEEYYKLEDMKKYDREK